MWQGIGKSSNSARGEQRAAYRNDYKIYNSFDRDCVHIFAQS